MLYGCDLSYANGLVDWTLLAPAIDFAIIRGGYGQNNIDTQAVNNLTYANLLHVPVGLYWFSYATSTSEARQEAIWAKDFSSDYTLTYPIFFDFEYDSIENAEAHGVTVTRQFVQDVTTAFCDTIIQRGGVTGVYFNTDFRNRFYTDSYLSAHPLYNIWFAKWSSTPPPFYNIWQNSNTGTLPGVNGYVDLDIIGDNPPSPHPSHKRRLSFIFYTKQL